MDQTASPSARPADPVPTPGSRYARARRRWKTVPLPIRIVGYVLLALFIAWLVLFITKGRFLKGPFQSIASRSLQRDVQVGGDFQLYFAPINIKFLAQDMRIANPAWAGRQPFFHARLIDTRISLVSLLFQDKKRARWLNLRDAAVDLQWSPDGTRNTWTFGDPNARGEPMEMPVITRANITGTNISMDGGWTAE